MRRMYCCHHAFVCTYVAFMTLSRLESSRRVDLACCRRAHAAAPSTQHHGYSLSVEQLVGMVRSYHVCTATPEKLENAANSRSAQLGAAQQSGLIEPLKVFACSRLPNRLSAVDNDSRVVDGGPWMVPCIDTFARPAGPSARCCRTQKGSRRHPHHATPRAAH